jgi:CheY-like chemotaxis protein/DNA-binding XRE family transcriptional regulator
VQRGSEAKKEINLRFGTRVKRLRNDLGISQEDLAELAELDRTYIGHVERGARNVSLSTIDKLARALKVSTASLLSEPEEKEIGPAKAKKGMLARRCVDILLVEDRSRDAELTLRAFRDAGITNSIHIVRDGVEALDFVFCTGRYSHRTLDDEPRVILLDLQLPKIGGMEVLRRITANKTTRNIPVVVLTVSSSDESISQALRLGASAYLVKPVNFHSFSDVIPKLNFRWALLEPGRDRSR